MRKIIAIVTLWCFGFMITSCSEDDLGLADVKLSFTSTSSASGSSTSRIADHIEITQALIGIDKIEIKSNDSGEEEENEYNYAGPYVINLLDGSSDPELPLTEIVPGVYNKAEAELVPVVEDSYSVVISGMFGDTPYTFLWTNTEDFKAESDQGFELSAEILNNLLISIDLHALFEGVDFELAVVNNDGNIILSKDSNTDLADIVEANIEAASEIGLDQDTDSVIDE